MTQNDESGNPIDTFIFFNESSYIVYNLPYNVTYHFTLYAGNSYGFDLTEGPSVDASTLSKTFFLSFFSSAATLNLSYLSPLLD